MTGPADAVIWSLARQCRPGDVLVVGVGTPIALAAGLLARELLVPDLTLIASSAVQPPLHDIAVSMVDPTYIPRQATAVLGHTEVLDLIGRGGITLQFVSPAEVDGTGALNTTRVRAPDGTDRRLPGALALPDVAVLVGRLVAYRIGHSKRFLPAKVHHVTGAAGRVTRVVTEAAEFAVGPDRARIIALQPGHDLDQVRAATGFDFTGIPDTAPDLTAEARQLLDTAIDRHHLRDLESRDGRPAARARLQALTAQETTR
ncbi:hypothetical protein GIS00_05735 [Nakamurella sp. YIM 132087]|uniref:CoA-transferase n=1 Tax=Nakamurella alba TaxID=2665158 RepID=A0A7K1FH48_9ACTN|nr:hypothetical protein [Nakamurella alba]MTD13445.1 hypothetical protein [Nakamurella alba]